MSGSTRPAGFRRAESSPPPGAGDHLLIAEEVAELLAVPASWVRQATRTGALPHVRLGRYVRYQRATVFAWIEDQRGKSAPIGVR